MAQIGTSELDIFPLALGANTFGWTSDRTESEKVLDSFTEAGGNFIDTADSYSAWVPGNSGGESETILGQWLATRQNRGSMVVATKVSRHPQFKGLGAQNIQAAADASLQRLQSDYIDLYYAHFDDDATALEETVAAFDALVKAGKVRYVGISNYTAERAAAWLRIARENGFDAPVALQPQYNLVARRNFEQALAPVAADHALSVFPYYSLASGFLSGKYRAAGEEAGSVRGAAVAKYLTPEGFGVLDALDGVAAEHGVSVTTAALAWVLAQPTVTAPLVSARTVEQLPDLLAAVDVRLSAEQLAALEKASEPFA